VKIYEPKYLKEDKKQFVGILLYWQSIGIEEKKVKFRSISILKFF